MMDAQTLWNLLAYSAQVACVVGLAGLLSMLLRVDAPSVRYVYWRLVLAFCLALPWLQARAPAAAVETVTTGVVAVSWEAGAPEAPVPGGAGSALPWLALAGAAIVSGALLRLAWVGAGLIRLRRLRASGTLAPAADHQEWQTAIGTRAEVRYVPGLAQPVTFGLRRPVILLPEALRGHSPAIRQAVLCHELIHVRRRDWLWLVAEELVRAAFWFHPAIWWLVSQIQLAREEAVDDLTVRATRGRRAYIEALMAFADEAPEAAAAAFSRGNHLFRRIVLVSKEAAMSVQRVVLSCAMMALAVGGGGWYATAVFPLVATVAAQQPADGRLAGGLVQVRELTDLGPLEQEAKAITPENPIPRRVFSVPAYYPPEGRAYDARATVALRITLDRSGRVAEVRRLRVSVTTGTRVVVPAGTADALGEAFVAAAADAVSRWQYEPPADAPIAISVTFRFSPDAIESSASQGSGGVTPLGVPGAAVGVLPKFPSDPVRVGGSIREPVKVKDVRPVYPAIAQQARVQGMVIIEATIAPDGSVAYARVLRSVNLLDNAALDAVRQWQFVPTLLNGAPVPVVMTVTVNFSLAPDPPGDVQVPQ